MDMTTVHTAASTAEAEVVAGLLRSQGIEVVTVVADPYTEFPTHGGEGVVNLTVPDEQADDARRVLAEAEAEAAEAAGADQAGADPTADADAGTVPGPPT